MICTMLTNVEPGPQLAKHLIDKGWIVRANDYLDIGNEIYPPDIKSDDPNKIQRILDRIPDLNLSSRGSNLYSIFTKDVVSVLGTNFKIHSKFVIYSETDFYANGIITAAYISRCIAQSIGINCYNLADKIDRYNVQKLIG